MKKFFTYDKAVFETKHNLFGNPEKANKLVEGILTLAHESYDNQKGEDYAGRNKIMLSALANFALGNEGEQEDPEAYTEFSVAMIRSNPLVKSRFAAVLAQVINAIVPEVYNDQLSGYIAETRQIGWGDSATFRIESNELFQVKSKAEGLRKGVDQMLYDDEVTVVPQQITVDASFNWYQFATGVLDIGNWGARVGRSVSAYLFIRIIRSMTKAVAGFGDAYNIKGIEPNLWGDLRDKVMAANGGMGVIALGTAVALSNVHLDGNYQVEIGEEMNKVGYLNQYLNTPLIALRNVLVPGTTNTTARLALPNNKILLVPVAGDRPVKTVFEGTSTTVNFDETNTADKRIGMSIDMHVGMSAVCGSKYGSVDLPE